MTDQRPIEGELDDLAVRLEAAGLLEVCEDAEGHEGYRLTPHGGRVGRMLALAGDDEGVVLDALLGTDAEG